MPSILSSHCRLYPPVFKYLRCLPVDNFPPAPPRHPRSTQIPTLEDEDRFANLVLHGQSREIRRLNQKIGELEEKILDKDDEIHNWWTDGKDKGETIRRKDRELAEKEEDIEEKNEEIAALKAELEEFRANQEAKVGGEEGERSAKRRRSQ
ncbi:hypothetical protein EYC80_009567 [Monilinia laxa]|uniref:Uncharacterized protein n=1 Tax=Monilinia laxa TaxID=61186 RepID=A0A5N6JYA3_MONLA|nr:hypothetical protein EYC80_009567 [Monilinia laxa]